MEWSTASQEEVSQDFQVEREEEEMNLGMRETPEELERKQGMQEERQKPRAMWQPVD